PPSSRIAQCHLALLLIPRLPRSTLFPYTTLFRSVRVFERRTLRAAERDENLRRQHGERVERRQGRTRTPGRRVARRGDVADRLRSEEHTSELQSRENLVCRLLLEKKNQHSRPEIT